MEGERFKENSLNKREITRNESSPEQKECEEVTESDNSTVAQQQISNDIGQNNTVKIVQKVADVKPPTLSVNLDTQRVSRHFPTFSHTLDTAPVAVVVGCSALISNISGDVKQNSNKMPRMPRRTARDVSGNQGRDPYIRDISGDKVAVGELDGQIIAVPSRRERANGNRERSDAFRTPLQSPTLYLKYCNKLLMAPKKRRFRRYFR